MLTVSKRVHARAELIAQRIRSSQISEHCGWLFACASTSAPMRFYLSGYEGQLLPRRWRRRIAGTKWHRAWLSGYMGIYHQEGVFYGVCERDWIRYRKRFRETRLWPAMRCLIAPWSRPVPFKK